MRVKSKEQGCKTTKGWATKALLFKAFEEFELNIEAVKKAIIHHMPSFFVRPDDHFIMFSGSVTHTSTHQLIFMMLFESFMKQKQ